MANVIALMIHCKEKGDAAIIGDLSHIHNWERGNPATAASVYPIIIKNEPDGTIPHDEIEFFCKIVDPHLVVN